MFYEAELFFACQLLKKQHIPANTIKLNSAEFEKADILGALQFFSNESETGSLKGLLLKAEKKKIYKVKGFRYINFVYMLLPDTKEPTVLLIGPYITQEITPKKILELGENFNLNSKSIKELELAFSQISIIVNENYLNTLIDTLGEFIWGTDGYELVNINDEERIFTIKNVDSSEDILNKMQLMEKRYSYENELIDAVAHGRMQKAENIFPAFSLLSFERRLTDQLRNIKNYCIIMNTLLRKAAEKGGVHPIYIDLLSAEYAKKIELLPSVKAATNFMGEMYEGYCTLVRRKSVRHYSPIIEKAIAYIDNDLTANLTLGKLAQMSGVSEGYFSVLFKKETGQTLSSYITEKRIELAKNLLRTTNLQIQTVAQHCGIYDVHYFSKLFKGKTGKTPKEYRDFVI